MNTFVPRDGGFAKLDVDAMSFNDMAEHLGYHPNQLRMYSNYDDPTFYWVAFKIFTKDIVHIATSHDLLTPTLVEQYVGDYKAKYDSGDIEDILEEGVANASLTSDYLSEVLRLGTIDPNGSVVSQFLGYELVFMDGKLIGYNASDGFNKWAKLIKESNPKLFSSYVVAIRKRGGSEELVREEINAQGAAFASIPQGLLNPHIDRYRSSDGTIDFVKLKATHYN
ncbi:MAG TPA: hypothetical protein PLB89_06915 [Flavobacteriales bacterium]|nr:hypothetical protein [Flavobacteriales bacterium]